MTWLILYATRPTVWAAETSLSSDTPVSSEGYFVLSWDSESNANVRLQQATNSNFIETSEQELPPRGSLTVTGLRDGEYFFRIQRDSATLAGPILVSVQHHSITRALGFFGLGLLLFSALVVTIIIGHRHQND